VCKSTRAAFDTDEWGAFSALVGAAVDVLVMDSTDACAAMLRAALKVRLAPETAGAPARGGPQAPRSAKQKGVLGHYRDALKGGPLDAYQLAERISELSAERVTQACVYHNLRLKGLVGVTRAKNARSRNVDLLSLREGGPALSA
jgi:hypothetical protein